MNFSHGDYKYVAISTTGICALLPIMPCAAFNYAPTPISVIFILHNKPRSCRSYENTITDKIQLAQKKKTHAYVLANKLPSYNETARFDISHTNTRVRVHVCIVRKYQICIASHEAPLREHERTHTHAFIIRPNYASIRTGDKHTHKRTRTRTHARSHTQLHTRTLLMCAHV